MKTLIPHVERYDTGAIVFHWLMFMLVVIVGVLGLLHDSWPKATQAFWINIHAVFGVTLWLLLVFRLWWRVSHPPPPLPQDIGVIDRYATRAVHYLLYALLFVTPIVGAVTFIWHGRVFDLAIFQVDFRAFLDRKIFEPTEDVHGYLAYGLFALAAVHAAAALWHRFVKHDGVFWRMWPFPGTRSRSTQTNRSSEGL